MIRDGWCSQCGGNPAETGAHCNHGTMVDLKVNLDEEAMRCAQSAPFFDEMARYWLDRKGKALIQRDAHWLRIRQVALLAAFYVEEELRKLDGKHELVQTLLANLEAGTCPTGCDEIRGLLEDLLNVDAVLRR